jgi:hypothetical protein
MPHLSLRQASQTFAVSRQTLGKALENGTVSGTRDAKGRWQIDSAELMRVYAPRPVAGRTRPDTFTTPAMPETGLGHDINDTASAATLATLTAELAAEREKVRLLERHLQDMRDMRALLPAPDAPRRRWWPW